MVFSLISRIRSCLDPPKLPKVGSAIRIGLLGVSRITPLAILHPSNQIPNSIVYSVASRSLDKAKTFAGKYGLETFYGSYQELLDDEKVDCVFIALPNGLHYEWTLKAIKAGKHILVEKPSFSNEKEARDVFEKGREKGVLVLEVSIGFLAMAMPLSLKVLNAHFSYFSQIFQWKSGFPLQVSPGLARIRLFIKRYPLFDKPNRQG